MNFLNTNVILDKGNKNHSLNNNRNNNDKLILQLKKLLSSSSRNISHNFINNTSQEIEYIGEGINGSLYKIPKTTYKLNEGKYYIVKVFKYNPKSLKQIKKELKLLKHIETYEYTKRIINPCLDTILTKSYIITVFDTFNGITLLDFIKECHNDKLEVKARNTLLKYCLKEVFNTIYKIHKIGLSHLQITPDSVLIKLNTNLLNLNNNINDANTYLENDLEKDLLTNVDNLDIKKLNKEKLIPRNSNIYRLENNKYKNPIEIKLTNFGLGCGKLSSTQKHGTNSIDGKNSITYKNIKCKTSRLAIIDPYINNHDFNIGLGMKYDLFNCGILGLMCILKYEFIKNEILDVSNFTNHLANVKSWSMFLNSCNSHLLTNDFMIYYDNLCKYCLGPLKNRINAKLVQEYIIVAEKHIDKF